MDIVANLTTMNKSLEEENKKLKEENKNDWKVIAKNKTEILMKYLPDYNPLFYPGSDSENIEECFKKQFKKQSEKYQELCYENDEINRKWAEDNERHTDILSEQQEQIKDLELRSKELDGAEEHYDKIICKLKEENEDIEGQLVDALISVKELEEIVEEQRKELMEN